MRNIFDQYKVPENRLTHALGSCLQRDRRLLREFVKWVTHRRNLAWRKLEVFEQQIPGSPVGAWNEEEAAGLPDLWIHGDGKWSLIIESKIMAKVSSNQLRAHQRTARRNGFTDVDTLVLCPVAPSGVLAGVKYLTWPGLYCWLRRHATKSDWARCMAQYMEVAEVRMTTDEYLGDYALTEFDGIPFGPDHPYTYREAKRVLKLALEELRKYSDLRKEVGMYPKGKGRPAITGSADNSVWDFLPLRQKSRKSNFTSYPHLTLSIQRERVVVIVTLPNAVPAKMRKNLTNLGFDRFVELVEKVEAAVSKSLRKVPGAVPFMEVAQRHYLTQRSTPISDARLEFDLRTAVGSKRCAVKTQPQWLESTFSALEEKRSNLQVGIGARIPYNNHCLHSRDVLDVIAGVWIACRPWIRTILSR